jgi:hypothetical protein
MGTPRARLELRCALAASQTHTCCGDRIVFWVVVISTESRSVDRFVPRAEGRTNDLCPVTVNCVLIHTVCTYACNIHFNITVASSVIFRSKICSFSRSSCVLRVLPFSTFFIFSCCGHYVTCRMPAVTLRGNLTNSYIYFFIIHKLTVGLISRYVSFEYHIN